MLNISKIALIIIISLLLQVTIIARISVFGSKFDLLLALVICVALLTGTLYGEVIGFISGICYDIISGGPFGAHSFSMAIIGYGVGFFHGSLYVDNPLTQALFGFGGTLVVKLLTSVYLGLFADPRLFSVRPLGLIFVAIINSLFVIAYSWIVRKFLKVRKME